MKPNNIFISKDYKIKIGDFGISKILKDSDYTNTNYIGTLGYMAPELLSKEKYNNKADIWSLGCIIYELCTLNACFEINFGDFGFLNKIKECEYEKNQLSNDYSDWKNIIESLLKKNYKDRPDINELYNLVLEMGHINITIEQKYINSLDEISRNIFIERIINEKQVNIIETNLELVKPKLIQFIEANSFKRKMELLFQILEELKITKKQDKYESICSTLEGTIYNKNFVSEFLKEQKVIETLYKILDESKVEKKIIAVMKLLIKINENILRNIEGRCTSPLEQENHIINMIINNYTLENTNNKKQMQQSIKTIILNLCNSLEKKDFNFLDDLGDYSSKENIKFNTTYLRFQRKLGMKKLTQIELFRTI